MADGFSGMADLIRGLEQLPEQLKGEAAHIVEGSANGMAAAVRQAYPIKEGDLVKGVVVEKQSPLRVRVRNTARHSHLYERGTVQRATAGTGANRGTMPAKPTFIPAAVKARARMVTDLTTMLKRTRVAGMDGTPEVRET
jgi:hypothetical protein